MSFRPVSLLRCLFHFRGGFPDAHPSSPAEWRGVDTVVITAGVSSLQPLLSVANLKHDSDHVELEGVKRVVEVAQAALHSNFIGPLVSATTFVREPTLPGTREILPADFRSPYYSPHQIPLRFSSCPPWPP
jgi:hypothetical protein